jgi:nitronate monooxygenase
MLSPEEIKAHAQVIRQRTSRPFNLNFFCHKPPKVDSQREDAWKNRLAPYYREFGLDPSAPVQAANRTPFC